MKPFKNEKMNVLWGKLVNRETIAYLIAGVMTTVINIVVYHVCYNVMTMENLVANSIAWVVAVIFAYFVNDKFVFLSKKQSAKKELAKMGKFFGARIASFAFDQVGMYIMVDACHINGTFSKIVINVFVVVINYVLSKLFVFNSADKDKDKIFSE